MQTYKFPSGASFPQLGLGTWQGDHDKLRVSLKEALKLGYRHVDSAWAYLNDEVLGQVFREAFEEGILTRQELFYTSKLPQHGHRRDKVKEFLQKTLKNVGLDYLDLYLIHFPVSAKYVENVHNWPTDSDGNILLDDELDLLETWRGMEDCVDAGLVKDIGLSNFNAQQVQYIYDNARIKPATNQVECHIYMQQDALVEQCKKLGMPLTAYSPMGSQGSPAFFSRRFPGRDFSQPYKLLDEPLLKKLAEKHRRTPAQIALRFLVQRGIAIIPKSVTVSRLKENAQVFDFSLDEEDMEQIRGLEKGVRLFPFDFVKGTTASKKYPF